jgi:type IV pilus assembly protein PilA
VNRFPSRVAEIICGVININKPKNKNMKTSRSTKGFTLVEIMIVVVIIGLLAAMAIPAFKKVRENSINGALKNDARQISSAAQQYMLENSLTQTSIGIAADGTTAGPLAAYVKRVGKGTLPNTVTLDLTTTFTMSHPQGGSTWTFTPEGQPQ